MNNFLAGNYINQKSYKSFQPNFINREWEIFDMEVISLLSEADRQLGSLNMYSKYIPNVDLFISMHVIKEATQSSKIEGTQTNIGEALLEKEDVPLDKRNDWEEVQNYIEAMKRAISLLEELPFSSRLIREAHRTLMQGVRGEHKQPGAFRYSQNWIGGAAINDATFIPPVFESIPELMSDLEMFIHNESIHVPELIKIAIVHYQFETIHPFLDGNGRVGRLMITLYLVSKRILTRPILYLSDFFERNRTHYYDNLMKVREKNNLSQWLKFFLVGVIETATNGITTFDKIMQLQKDCDAKLQTLGSRAANAKTVLNELYMRPIISAEKVAEVARVSMPSAYTILRCLEEKEIIREVTGGKRGRTYVFEDYMNLF